MSAKRFPMDRSVAFTILLDVWPDYGNSPVDGGQSITAFLDDWYADPSTDMYEFAQRWITTPAAAAMLAQRRG